MRPAYRIGPARDPIREAAFELRAMVTSDVWAEYEKLAAADEPSVPSKLFLQALAETLSISQLRST
jgi:hypothetical protein